MSRSDSSDEDATLHPTEILINVIVTLLAPMFVMSTSDDIGLARVAALETIICYRVQNHAGLISVAIQAAVR